MPRLFIETKPKLINKIVTGSKSKTVLKIATSNKNKIQEFQYMLRNVQIEGIDLKLDEVQSLDAIEVANAYIYIKE